MSMFGSNLDQDNDSLNKAIESFKSSPVFSSENTVNENNPMVAPAAGNPFPETDSSGDRGEKAFQPAMPTSQMSSNPSPHSSSIGKIGQRIAGVIGDALLLANGRYPLYLPAVMEHNRRIDQQNTQQQQRDFNSNLATSKLSQQQANMEAKANQPQYHFGTDGRILSLNPMTGEATQIRDPDAPSPSEHERMISRISNLPSSDPERKLIEQMLFKKKQ